MVKAKGRQRYRSRRNLGARVGLLHGRERVYILREKQASAELEGGDCLWPKSSLSRPFYRSSYARLGIWKDALIVKFSPKKEISSCKLCQFIHYLSLKMIKKKLK